VHAIEQADGQSFIVMELVDGEPLAARIAGHPMEIAQLLDSRSRWPTRSSRLTGGASFTAT
jgi:hypothetical protein